MLKLMLQMKRYAPVVALLAVLSLGMVACGGSNGTSTASSTGSSLTGSGK